MKTPHHPNPTGDRQRGSYAARTASFAKSISTDPEAESVDELRGVFGEGVRISVATRPEAQGKRGLCRRIMAAIRAFARRSSY